VNMPNIPLALWLGGVQAKVLYQGRSGCCIGEDQIVFTVPDNVPTGCAVPLVVQIGTTTNTISNSTVLPVAKGSRNCTPTDAALASINAEQAVMAGSVTFGIIELDKFGNDTGTGYVDRANFEFGKIPTYAPGTQPFFVSWIDEQPPGTCIVYNHLNGESDPPIGNPAELDAGSSFTVKGPNGTVTGSGKPGGFNVPLSTTGTFLVPGAYTVTGTGGSDIGPVSAAITIPASPALVSPENNATVTRSNGMTVTWTGGAPNGNVLIRVYSAINNAFNTGDKARCMAPASAGTFTIPPYVMLALPAGNFAGFTIAPAKMQVPFTAKGLDFGSIQINYDGTGFGYGAGTGGLALR
jgi:hypothetical protein